MKRLMCWLGLHSFAYWPVSCMRRCRNCSREDTYIGYPFSGWKHIT